MPLAGDKRTLIPTSTNAANTHNKKQGFIQQRRKVKGIPTDGTNQPWKKNFPFVTNSAVDSVEFAFKRMMVVQTAHILGSIYWLHEEFSIATITDHHPFAYPGDLTTHPQGEFYPPASAAT